MVSIINPLKYVTFIINEGSRKASNGLSVTRRSLPEDKDIFTYNELAKDMWRDIMKQAQKHYDIHFDLENNDPYSKQKARLIRISRPSDDKVQRGKEQPEDVFAVRCQLWHAGGDWELPVMYFKCQLQENSFYGLGSMKIYLGDLGMYRNSHWIMIPPFKAGNYNLVPNDKDNSFRAMHNDEENREYNTKEPDKDKAWEWLQEQFMQMVTDHCMGKNRQPEKGVSAMDRISWDDYNGSLLKSASKEVEATDLDKNFKKIRNMLKPELSKQEIGAINKELDIIYKRYRALEGK